MKKLFVLLMALFTLAQVDAQEKNVIRIATDNTDLILQVAPNGRLYQAYLGDKLLNEKDINNTKKHPRTRFPAMIYTRSAKMPIIVTAAKRNRTTTSFGKNAAIL